MGTEKGGMTLFLSLLLAVLISFLCTALQSARMAGSRYLFTLASEAAVKSMFAAYDTRVWEQYRILALSDETLAAQIGQECTQVYGGNGTLFSVSVSEMEITGRQTLADDGAAGWEHEAVSYMETRLPVEMVSWLWEQSGLAEGLENMTKWLSGLKDLFGPMVELEKKLCELESRLEKAVDAFSQGQALLGSLGGSAVALRGLLEEHAGEEELQAAWEALRDTLFQVKEHAHGRAEGLADMIRGAIHQLEAAGDLKERIRALLAELGEEDITGMSLLSGLGDYLGGLTGRFDFLSSLPQELEAQQAFLGQFDGLRMPSLEEILGGEGREALSWLQEQASGLSGNVWDPERLSVTEGSEEDAWNLTRVTGLKDWLERGVLSLVLEDSSNVSQASLGREITRTERVDSAGLWDRAYGNLLYGEYAVRYTAGYGEEGGAGLQYETEYLIAGEKSDLSNLSGVAKDLLLLRGAANLSWLLIDEGSRMQAEAVAAGISLVLGGWIPVTVLSVLLMALWALAEAVCDVRGLLSGGKVPFLKDASSWKLSWSGLWSLLDGSGFIKGSREEGMSYEDYLRILLFLTPLEEKCFRTMEVAEENLRAGREDFQIDRALCGAQVTLRGQAAGKSVEVSLQYGYGQ